MGIRKIRTEQGMPIERNIPIGSDPTKAIDALYRDGRQFPRGTKPRVDVYARDPATAKRGTFGGGTGLEEAPLVNDLQANQDPQDRHGAQYNNEPSVKSWLRGGADAPHFDRGGSGNRYRK
jgi:hypothetical protein